MQRGKGRCLRLHFSNVTGDGRADRSMCRAQPRMEADGRSTRTKRNRGVPMVLSQRDASDSFHPTNLLHVVVEAPATDADGST